MRLHQQHQGRVIHAFEPNTEALCYLSRNVAALGDHRITIHPCALGNLDGTTTFFPGKSAASMRGTTTSSLRSSDGPPRPVRVERLARVATEQLGGIALLKLDVEGGEFALLNDLQTSGALTECRRIVAEIHHQVGGSRTGGLLDMLERSGFAIDLVSAHGVGEGRTNLVLRAWRPHCEP